MKVALLGATGKIGILVVDGLWKEGVEVAVK